MLDPEKVRERVTLLQRLRELPAERIEQEIGDQERTLKLLEEKTERPSIDFPPLKYPIDFETALICLANKSREIRLSRLTVQA